MNIGINVDNISMTFNAVDTPIAISEDELITSKIERFVSTSTIHNILPVCIDIMSEQHIPVKIVVVGDRQAEKTALLHSYVRVKDPPSPIESTVFENYCTSVKVDFHTVNLGLWDTAGQEQYDRLRPLAYPYCDVFLIVFSVIDPPTFTNAMKKWYPELQENVGKVPKIFVGTKKELREEYLATNTDPKNKPIMPETASKIIKEEFQCPYMQCSVKTQEGVKEVFEQAMRIVIRKKSKKIAQMSTSSFCCF